MDKEKLQTTNFHRQDDALLEPRREKIRQTQAVLKGSRVLQENPALRVYRKVPVTSLRGPEGWAILPSGVVLDMVVCQDDQVLFAASGGRLSPNGVFTPCSDFQFRRLRRALPGLTILPPGGGLPEIEEELQKGTTSPWTFTVRLIFHRDHQVYSALGLLRRRYPHPIATAYGLAEGMAEAYIHRRVLNRLDPEKKEDPPESGTEEFDKRLDQIVYLPCFSLRDWARLWDSWHPRPAKVPRVSLETRLRAMPESPVLGAKVLKAWMESSVADYAAAFKNLPGYFEEHLPDLTQPCVEVAQMVNRLGVQNRDAVELMRLMSIPIWYGKD